MRLVAYGQYALSVLIMNGGKGTVNTYGPRCFIGKAETIKQKADSNWRKGQRPDGQVFWTTPIGLILEVKELPIVQPPVEGCDHDFPTADWLHVSLSFQEYLKVPFDPSQLRSLYTFTTEGSSIKEKIEAEAYNEVSRLLNMANVPDTPEYRHGVIMINDFDYFYSYSGDVTAWKLGESSKKDIQHLFKDYPGMLKYFSTKFEAANVTM